MTHAHREGTEKERERKDWFKLLKEGGGRGSEHRTRKSCRGADNKQQKPWGEGKGRGVDLVVTDEEGGKSNRQRRSMCRR